MGLFHGGDERIRTSDTLPHTRFRVVRLQPLGHISSIILTYIDILDKVWYNVTSKILEFKIKRGCFDVRIL